ncbi:hypothetical protein ACFXTH_024077 [Malus domestica]
MRRDFHPSRHRPFYYERPQPVSEQSPPPIPAPQLVYEPYCVPEQFEEEGLKPMKDHINLDSQTKKQDL